MTRAMLIFPEVVDRLTQDPSKTFATDAVKFAQMWYTRAPKSMQNKFKKLVQNGQIDLCMGGWVENDESLSYFEDIIGSFYMGHNWIRNEFGITPSVGMNIQAHSHSETNAALFHDLGFQALFFSSKYVQDKKLTEMFKEGNHDSHFMWQAMNSTFGSKKEIIAGVLNPLQKKDDKEDKRLWSFGNLNKKLYRI